MVFDPEEDERITNLLLQAQASKSPKDVRRAILAVTSHVRRWCQVEERRGESAADDVGQEVLIEIVDKIHCDGFQPPTSYAWRGLFKKMVKRRFADLRRKRKPVSLSESEWIEAPSDGGSNTDLPEDLRVKVARLPERERQVVIIVGLQRKTMRKAAEELGYKAHSAVAGLYKSGLKRLERALERNWR